VKEGATFGILHEGAHLRRGAHHHLWEAILRGGSYYKGKNKGKAREKVKQEQSQTKSIRKRQRQAKEERHTKARGALLHKASGEVFKELQGIREWLLLYQVHLYMFHVLYILL
jgi:hypothetical protein